MSASENMTERTPMMKKRIPAMEKKSHGTNKKRFSAATAERELRSINMCDFLSLKLHMQRVGGSIYMQLCHLKIARVNRIKVN